MNRKLLALAVGAALALPVAVQAAPTVYGKLDVSLEHLDGEVGPANPATDVSDTTLESNKSRLGVRGEEKLNDSLAVVYQVEWGVSVDGDSINGPDLSQRDRFLGLQHKSLGTLKAGRMNTPLKEAEGKVDAFNGTRLDMENVFAGQNRESNSIAYTSPKIADALTVRFTHITGEGTASAGTGGGEGSANSLSVAFENDTIYLAAAMDNDVVGDADDGTLNNNDGGSFYGLTDAEVDTVRLVGAITVGGLRVGALYQEAEAEGAGVSPEQTGYLVSAAYTAGKWTFKGEYAASEGEQGSADLGEITQIAVGADYQWTQTFKTYGFLGQFEFDAVDPAADTDLSLLGVGMALNF